MLERETLKKIRRIQIRTRTILESGIAGSYHAVFKGRGMEFAEVREYQPGDDVRTIDWNVTARMGTAAVLAFSAVANHDRVGAVLFSDRTSPRRGDGTTRSGSCAICWPWSRPARARTSPGPCASPTG